MPLETSIVAAFVARHHDTDPASIRLSMERLRGGLRSADVVRVRAEFRDRTGRRQTWVFVAKRLDGVDRREASVYRDVLQPLGWDGSPRFLGSEPVAAETSYLYIEYVAKSRGWPWTSSNSSALTLEQLALLHGSTGTGVLRRVSPEWSYETDLLGSAHATGEMFEDVVQQEELAGLRPYRMALRRVIGALPELRETLLNGSPLAVTSIHGDAHPGNALMRRRSGAERTVLLDWGRARAGSPLEDVASWLQSLGYWEPEAKRRHDTLFRRYLESRDMPPDLTRSLRDHYWLAGMCNILSGSLRYHLWVAGGGAEAPSNVRAESLGAARDQLRVIRRADILWRYVITAREP